MRRSSTLARTRCEFWRVLSCWVCLVGHVALANSLFLAQHPLRLGSLHPPDSLLSLSHPLPHPPTNTPRRPPAPLYCPNLAVAQIPDRRDGPVGEAGEEVWSWRRWRAGEDCREEGEEEGGEAEEEAGPCR